MVDYGPRMAENRGRAGGGGDIAVHVELLARSLMRKQEGLAPEEEHRATANIHRISRVPVQLHDNNSKDYYTPGFVAIGPLHNREDRRLRPAERLKVVYLNGLICRGHPDPAHHLTVIQDYLRVVADREQEIRAMYVGEEVAAITADDFVQMMVLDGCFIIEHLVNIATGRDEPMLHGTPFGRTRLSVDLILAENQMPFFVLVDLFAATRLPEFEVTGYPPQVLLVKLVLFYLAGEKGRDMSDDVLAADGVSHILHLLHAMITTASTTMWEPPPRGRALALMRLLRRLPSQFAAPLLRGLLPEGPRRRVRLDYVPSASDMKRMRVQFKKARGGPGSKPVVGIAAVMGPVPLSVMLHEDHLHLPQLWLEFRTAPLLLNLMAFEQSSQVTQNVSSYVAFMAKLVQTAEDAGLLTAAEVVQQHSGAGNKDMEEVARFFQMVGVMTKAASTLQTSHLRVTLELLRKRSQSWANMERNYFTRLAELVALVTFVSSFSTIIQTFAAFKYH